MYVLHLFVDLSIKAKQKYLSIEVTIASYMIDEFNFSIQYMKERRVYASITILLGVSIVIWSKKSDIHHNGGRAQLIERKCFLLMQYHIKNPLFCGVRNM